MEPEKLKAAYQSQRTLVREIKREKAMKTLKKLAEDVLHVVAFIFLTTYLCGYIMDTWRGWF